MKNNETHSLIIGPHSSNVISEIILSAVDRKLVGNWEYIRCIDDYSCYVENEEDASRFLIELAKELRYYDLQLNYKKTTIERLPVVFSSHWSRKLCDKRSNYGSILKYSDVRSYIDNALELMKENQDNSAILKYAIKVLSNQNMTENAKTLCRKEFLHLALVYPYLIPLLEDYVIKPYNVKIEELEKFASIAYKNGFRDGNHEEAYFGLYFAWKYGFTIANIETEEILKTDNCILKLLGMLYCKENTNEYKKYKKHARYLLNKTSEMDRNWVFIYETLPANDFGDEWKCLKNNKISFIKDLRAEK